MKADVLISHVVALIGSFLTAAVNASISFAPASYFDGCTAVNITAHAEPDRSTYYFSWFLKGTENVQLAFVGLDGKGNVVTVKRNTEYSNQYEINNDPSTLNPIVSPFQSILTFHHLASNETVELGIFEQETNKIVAVTPPRCTFPDDPGCTGNCLKTLLCDMSFTKQCQDGSSVVQECPANVTTVVYKPCGTVQCDLRSLEEENLVPSNTQNGVVDAGDKVTFICKEGFAGNKAVYVCSSDGKLIPTGESADCKAVEDAYVAMHSQRNGSYVGLIAAVATIIVIAVTRWMCWGNSKTRNKQIN